MLFIRRYLIPAVVLIFGPSLLAHASESEGEANDPEVALESIHLPHEVPILAATTYAGMTMGAIMTPQMRLDYERIRNSLAANGYVEKFDTIPRPDYVLNRLEERRQLAIVAGRPDDAEILGFYAMESVHARGYAELPFVPRFLPQSYRDADSDAFLVVAGNHITQVYTQTVFGALLIDEFENATVSIGTENARIAGNPAVVVPVKHGSGKWATVVLAQQGNRVLVVESNQLLIGEKRKGFLQLVESLPK